MVTYYDHGLSPAMQAAIGEMRERISAGFPGATFVVGPGEDPAGTYLVATVDMEDTDEVVDLFRDRIVDLQVDEGLPLYVVVLRTPARVMQAVRELRAARLPRVPAF